MRHVTRTVTLAVAVLGVVRSMGVDVGLVMMMLETRRYVRMAVMLVVAASSLSYSILRDTG